jgi:hypothetical protein
VSLLAATQGLIARTYHSRPALHDAAPFVLGDEGYRRLARRHRIVHALDAPEQAPGEDPVAAGPRVLVRKLRGGTALAIYLPDALVARLEARPPSLILDDGNVDDFAAFVEEVDHFVALSQRLGSGRALHLLELELRANVSKVLVLSHFLGRLAGRPVLRAGERLWLRYHLFEKPRFCDANTAVRQRYEDARRFAVRFLNRLEDLPAQHRVAELRRWDALPGPEKVRELAAA